MGLYSLVGSIVAFVYMVARFGINDTVRRYVAELDGAGDRAAAGAVAGWGLKRGMVSAGTAALALGGASFALGRFFHSRELPAYVLLSAASLIPMLIGGLLHSVLSGLQRYRYFVLLNLATSPLWAAASILVVVRGGGIAGLLIVGIGINMLNLVALATWVRRELGLRWHARLPAALGRRLLRYNLALAALVLLNGIVWKRSELFFLGRFHGTDQVAFYDLPFALTERLTTLLPGALLGVLLPGLTFVQGAADPSRFTALFSEAVRYLALLVLPICCLGIPLAPTVIEVLYGPRYRPAGVVLQILLVAMLFGVLGEASSAALQGIERQGWLLKTGAAAAAVGLVLSFALIPRWGATGAALANTAAQAGWALAAFAPLRGRLVPATWTAMAKAGAVATVLGASLLAAVQLRPSVWLILAEAGTAVLLYAAAVLRFELVSTQYILSRLRRTVLA
jgi:O-antigen/teichoic acid export membrane protein